MDHDLARFRALTYSTATQKAYQCHRESYLQFCAIMGYCAVPASTATLCRYAAMLARTHCYSSIKQYLNIVRILHQEWDLPNPLENNFRLSCVLTGIRRALGDKVTRKAPITPEMLLGILSHLDLKSPLHANVWAAALTMFFAMLRRSNVLPNSSTGFKPSIHLRRRDITFQSDCVLIKIRWSKTIQFQQRELNIPLPRIRDNPLCPVQAVFHAFRTCPLAGANGPAFVCSTDPNAPPLIVSVFLNIIKSSLDKCNVDSKLFSGHSFRRGGASWAFQCGLPIDTIRQIGDWQSNSYTKYIFESPESLKRAMATLCVGISKPTT